MCRSPGAPAAICTPALQGVCIDEGGVQVPRGGCRIDRTLCMRL
jgi:hypothetical protein